MITTIKGFTVDVKKVTEIVDRLKQEFQDCSPFELLHAVGYLIADVQQERHG